VDDGKAVGRLLADLVQQDHQFSGQPKTEGTAPRQEADETIVRARAP
jgi:hypothetical protein